MRAKLVTRQVFLRVRRTTTNHCASSQRLWISVLPRMKSRLMNTKCLLIVTIPERVQPNSVPKLVVTGNVLHHDRVKCSFGFFWNVKMTRSMMSGHEVLVRASLLMVQDPSGVGFDGSEFNPIDDSSDADIFTSLSLSLTSVDEIGAWCIDAKLKMKVGVVSVTVEQDTEGRLQDSQSTLNLEMALYNVVSANPRVEAWRALS